MFRRVSELGVRPSVWLRELVHRGRMGLAYARCVRQLLVVCGCVLALGAVVVALWPGGGGGPERGAGAGWLGLNENTVRYLGPVDAFSKHGVVYDRSLEMQAGSVPSEPAAGTEAGELALRLREDHRFGMTPVATIEYRGYDRAGYEFRADPEFPHVRSATEEGQGRNTIEGYVKGFVRSASAILKLARERYPGMRVLFEPMNEPWGYTTPQYNGAQYAAVMAQLLPAAKAAGIVAGDIYVGATGEGCTDDGCIGDSWISAMYAAQPALRKEVEGWYFHPYGPPAGLLEFDNGGIESVPIVRDGILSGSDNVIVSEVGFCASDVNNPEGLDGGVDCHGAMAVDGATAARMLTEMLRQAEVYHREGWLRALIVYSRNDGGWAMQLKGGALTPSGAALQAFAEGASGSS